MRRVFRLSLWLLLALVVIGGSLAFWQREQLTRLAAFNTLFREDRIIHNFSNMNAAFLDRDLQAGSAPAGTASGYQWWLPPDAAPSEVYGRGVYGQFLWIDRDAGVAIAVNGADRGFRQPGVLNGNIAMLRSIVLSVTQP